MQQETALVCAPRQALPGPGDMKPGCGHVANMHGIQQRRTSTCRGSFTKRSANMDPSLRAARRRLCFTTLALPLLLTAHPCFAIIASQPTLALPILLHSQQQRLIGQRLSKCSAHSTEEACSSRVRMPLAASKSRRTHPKLARASLLARLKASSSSSSAGAHRWVGTKPR